MMNEYKGRRDYLTTETVMIHLFHILENAQSACEWSIFLFYDLSFYKILEPETHPLGIKSLWQDKLK